MSSTRSKLQNVHEQLLRKPCTGAFYPFGSRVFLRADPRRELPFLDPGIFANFCKSTLFFAHFCASERA
jgi:hypothetical protein